MAAQFEIWTEGYLTTGMDFPVKAELCAKVDALSFDEAVHLHVASLPADDAKYWKRSSAGRWNYWGCQIFDSETDARRAFG